MKTLPATLLAFSAIAVHVTASHAFSCHQDGDAIAILPLPEGHDVPPTDDPLPLEGMDEAAGTAAYRLAISPAKLAAIAAATGTDGTVIMELGADATCPTRILSPDGKEAIGWLMASPIGADLPEGLLVTPASTTEGTGKGGNAIPMKEKEKPAVQLPPPVITTGEKSGNLEINFGGRPEKEKLDAIKAPDLGFRYSGNRGTKRGVPPRTWYGPDNASTRHRLAELFPESSLQAA